MAKLVFYLGVTLLAIIIASLLEFWQFTHPKKLMTGKTPQDFGWPFEKVTLTTSDNLKLAGWFIPSESKSKESGRALIIPHGFGTDKSFVLEFASIWHADFDILLFDFRYPASFGFHEQKDLAASVEFLKERKFEKIGILSFSMGAAVTLLAADKLEGVGAIIAESPYATLRLMALDAYRNFSILRYPLVFLGNIISPIFIGTSLDSVSPEQAVKGVEMPIFLIGSEKDELIGVEHYHRLGNALSDNPKAEFWLVADSSHGAIYQTHEDEYSKRIKEFFRKNLGE